MTETKLNYAEVLQLFAGADDINRDLRSPFIQCGKYYATDRIGLISLPVEEVELSYHQIGNPDMQTVIPIVLHDPIGFNVEKFEETILAHSPMVPEMAIKEKECDTCEGEGEEECDLGHMHLCGTCQGQGIIEGKNPTGKQIPYEHTTFIFLECGFRYSQLMRVIKAAKLLEEKIIYKISGEKNKPFYFQIGKATVLVMNCMLTERDETYVDLPLDFVVEK